MKTSDKQRTLQWINKQYQKGTISFEHDLQRPVGQWNSERKSLLIHSLLYGFPVNPIYIVEKNSIMYPIDGSQRTSTCVDYINDEFALWKNTPSISLPHKEGEEIIWTEYELARKRFSKLDEEVQDALLACSLDFCTISDYTVDEVKEMFKRQNYGKPLTKKFLRIINESDDFVEAMGDLLSHPFMKKIITNTQHKNGTDRELIIRTLMLIETNKENDFTSFSETSVDNFIINYGDSALEKIPTLKEALGKFDAAFEKEIKIPVTSIPMILYCGYRITKDKKSFPHLIEIILEFLENYDNNVEYKEFTKQGTTGQENVRGRFDWWRERLRTA